ncbi:MAG: M23 family metallopeptidase [Oscillospiraceae bacterium]|nr:M23 family metallopeptidase [Oscillospiraceae bacterium]
MKLRKMAAVIISIILSISISTTVIAANEAYINQNDYHDELDNLTICEEYAATQYDITGYVNELSNSDTYGIETYSTTSNNYSVNWTVKAGTITQCSLKQFMNAGDTMTFNLTYTPASASVKIGVLTPKNTFRNYTVSNGKLSQTMTMTDTGIYQFRIQNTSASDVKFSGTFSFVTPFEYMFKGANVPKYLSSKYGEYRNGRYHYAIDITTGVSGEINGYSVYNTLSGNVKYYGVFTSDPSTCAAIYHDNGYTSRFLHMSLLSNKPSGYIETGTLIGYVSDIGSSGAYHLHYDVNNANTYNGPSLTEDNTVDPTILFPNVSFTS